MSFWSPKELLGPQSCSSTLASASWLSSSSSSCASSHGAVGIITKELPSTVADCTISGEQRDSRLGGSRNHPLAMALLCPYCFVTTSQQSKFLPSCSTLDLHKNENSTWVESFCQMTNKNHKIGVVRATLLLTLGSNVCLFADCPVSGTKRSS
ncbi:hypothetical protein IWX50DRAFT_255977 [Phyllosticta citricarpa]